MGSFAPLNNAGQQGGSAMTGSYSPTPSTMTPPPPQPGGGMRVGYDIINSPPTPGQQPQGFAALGPAIGSALGGIGLGGMPAPMQNPFLGGSSGGGMSQPMPAGWEPKLSSVNTTTTQDIMGRGANYPVGGGMGQPLSRAQLEAAVADDIATGRAIYRGPEGTQIHNDMIAKLQGNPSGANGPYPAQVSTLPVNVPQRKFAGAMPSIKEFRDATGADFKTASDLLYGVVGSSKDTRDWQKIFSSPDPIAAARQATAAMYGGVKQGTYTDPVTGKQNTMLMSGTGIPLTTPGNRDVNLGVGLDPNSGANFVSGLATNDRFPGAGAQQIQGQMPLQPQGQIPLQNPPTMGVGGGASQPMTVQDMIAKASGLIGSQGVGMGQPYISDKGYFGPGTMDNPTGPQFGQEGVVTQVSRPPVDVPQYSGGTTSQPQTMEDMLARARGLIGNQYGGMGQPMPLQVSRPPVDVPYGGDMGRLIPPQVSRPPVNDSRLGQPITSVGRQPPQQRMMPEALQNLRRRIGSGSGGISNLLNRIRG